MRKLSIIIILGMSLNGCKKIVSVGPPLSNPDQTVVYSTDASAISVITGLYSSMSSGQFASGTLGISVIAGLTSDELTAYPTFYTLIPEAYTNALVSTNAPFWTTLYNYVYTTNAVLEGIASSGQISPEVKQQLAGEAKFARAFCYFYLENLFGDVPLVTSTNYQVNDTASRTPKAQVVKQIISDLKDAIGTLNPNYVDITDTVMTAERVRPNKSTAMALLARVYLYNQDWADAEIQADSVINNSTLYQLDSLNAVFLANSTEAIWQLQPVIVNENTQDGNTFILMADPGNTNPVALSQFILAAFDSGDSRATNWVGSYNDGANTYYFPYKYKVKISSNNAEYLMVLRLAEQYLIRAEARAWEGNVSGAMADLNVIRTRAGLPSVTNLTQQELLAAVLHERQVELFTEWGHRWLDLKRTNAADSVMPNVAPIKGGSWNSEFELYPIPLTSAIQLDPNIKQNPGYQ
jgi:hypothetical protein